MYSGGYSQVSKYSPQAQKKMHYRSKGKSCGYYLRIVFFFSSLIQSLIIVSLVLFLIYGKKQDSASTSRIQDLEESFSRLSLENVALRHQRKNLTTLLNSTLTEKARNDWDLAELRRISNISAVIILDMEKRLQQCNNELQFCKSTTRLPGQCVPLICPGHFNCGLMFEQLRARLELVESNFTQTTQRMRMDMDQITKERDNLNLEAIRLRRDKSTHDKAVEFFRQKCKDDFSLSLSGVSNVTKAFLQKVDSLFPTHIAFQLTCPKQREHLEQIRTNCTSLSREVEDRFQHYLNSVGEKVSGIQAENSRLKAENWRLSEDYRWCSQNRTGLIQQHKQNLDKLQRKHDEDKERLLLDKMRLNGQIEVLDNSVKYKTKEAEHLTEQLKQLNMSCMFKTGYGGYSGSSTSRVGTSQSGWGMYGGGRSSSASSSSSGGGQVSRTGSSSSSSSSYGSTYNKPPSVGTGSSSSSVSSSGSTYNKPSSTGTGSSSPSVSSSGSTYNKPSSTGTGSSSSSVSSSGSTYNKPSSTGTGSSSSSVSSSGSTYNKPSSTGTGSSSSSVSSSGSSSSSGSAYSKPGSSGGAFPSYGSAGSNPSSSGTSLNKPALSGRGSSSVGSSSGSTGSSPNLSSSGTSLNKPTSNVRSSSGVGSSSGSTGSTSKSGLSSSGLSWFGFGSSNSGQSKTGSGTGKGTTSGSSYGGTGSSAGAGRTSGFVGGPVSIAQHLQELQRLINPPGPEEKQDLARVLG